MSEESLPDADRRLFREAVAGTRRLTTDRVHHEPAPPLPIPRQRERDEAAALDESLHGPALLDLFLEGGDETAWVRDGIDRSLLKDLRRGRWTVRRHLDLHGCTRDQARIAFSEFIAESLRLEQRCLRIVHGKGLGSPGREPVLKKLVLGWLAQHRGVLAFCQAPPSDGGAGAVLVLLRATRQP